jgi:hypothetical protein
MAEFQ